MGRNENLTRKILHIIEEEPYCSSSEIIIKGFTSTCIYIELKLMFMEHLIAAEQEADEYKESLFNIHLTLKGLKYLRNVAVPVESF